MELFTIDTILPAASGILFITQAIYHLGLYNKLYIHNKETVYTTDVNAENPPLSVIIVAKDAADELQENLPFILEQDYPEFEVIVIYDRSADDCDDTLKLLEDKYPNLYHTFIPEDRCQMGYFRGFPESLRSGLRFQFRFGMDMAGQKTGWFGRYCQHIQCRHTIDGRGQAPSDL